MLHTVRDVVTVKLCVALRYDGAAVDHCVRLFEAIADKHPSKHSCVDAIIQILVQWCTFYLHCNPCSY